MLDFGRFENPGVIGQQIVLEFCEACQTSERASLLYISGLVEAPDSSVVDRLTPFPTMNQRTLSITLSTGATESYNCSVGAAGASV